MNTIWRVSQYLFHYRLLFSTTLVLAVLMTGLTIAIPRAIQNILESLEAAASMQQLLGGVLIVALLFLGTEIFNGLRIWMNNMLEQRVLLDMRRDLHQKLMQLPAGFYDQRRSGEISSRVIEDVTAVERALLDGTEIGVRAVVMLLGVTVMLFLTNPFLAWFVFFPVPVLLVLGYFYAKGSRRVWKQVREAAGDLNSLLVEDIQGNRLIQTFALQEREHGRFKQRARTLRDRTLRAMYRWAIYSPATTYLTNLGIVAVVGIGGYLMINDPEAFGFPALVAFLMYAHMLYQPIGQLHGINHLLSAGRASGDRVFEILDATVDVEETDNPQPIPAGEPHVVFDRVTFRYAERAAVLDDFSLELEAGKVTALVGHTGAGKSTVANLAMRSYDPTAGQVMINGVDIRRFRLADLHNHIGHVAQDPFLFEGTVRDNLLLARGDAHESDLWNALEGACAREFVEQLPDGLDTNIGEKGIRLSQGEKQRLTIARVLLKNPPFIILDEATASVDTITEKQIQQALENLMNRRTVLVIAHRLSTIRKADRIVVLERGRIIETGTHGDLLMNGGRYSELWLHQVDVFQEEARVETGAFD